MNVLAYANTDMNTWHAWDVNECKQSYIVPFIWLAALI